MKDLFDTSLLLLWLRNGKARQEIAQQYDSFGLGNYPVISAVSKAVFLTAQNMGNLWIATVASVTNSTLLTTDQDFDHLDGVYLSLVWLRPEAYGGERGVFQRSAVSGAESSSLGDSDPADCPD